MHIRRIKFPILFFVTVIALFCAIQMSSNTARAASPPPMVVTIPVDDYDATHYGATGAASGVFSSNLRVRGGGPDGRAVLPFPDFPIAIPPTAKINWAHLHFHVNTVSGAPRDMVVGQARAPYGHVVGPYGALMTVPAPGSYMLDVTPIVQNWLPSPAPGFGYDLGLREAGPGGFFVYQIDSAQGASPAYLEIEFVP